MKKLIASVATLLFLSAFTMAGEGKMIRVEVLEQSGETPNEIKLNLPLSMLASLAPQVQQAIEQGLDEGELNGQQIDFRSIWREVRATGPNNYVEVNGEDGNITVSTTDTHLEINVTEDGKNLQARVPLELGDAIFDAESFGNFEDLYELLANFEGDLLTVVGDEVNVRVWVD